jgi:hypothetical protein
MMRFTLLPAALAATAAAGVGPHAQSGREFTA